MPRASAHSPARTGSSHPPGLSRRAFLQLAAAACAGAACGAGRAPEPVSEDVLAFHRQSLVLDLHVDTLLWMRLLGYDIAKRHANLLPGSPFGWHMDLPRAADGGLDGAVLGLVINPRVVRPELGWELRLLARLERGSGLDQTLATLDLLAETAQRHPQHLVFARSGSEVREAVAEGKFAALAGLEGAHGIEDRVENVRAAYQRGLRMIGLVHFQASAAAYPMTVASFDGRGLTPFGFDLVAEMEGLGMVVDLAHLNAAGVDDALGAMRRPCVVSHTACRALSDHARNLTDQQIRRVANAGGVVGLVVHRTFLGRPDVDGFLDHVEHALRVGGGEAVAIGSDWDGGIEPVEGLRDVRGLPYVTSGLLARGWPPGIVQKVLGENALRVLSEVCG